MEAKELLIGVLTKTLNKTEEEVSDLLYQKADDSDELVMKEGALDLALDLDATRIDNIKTSIKPDKKRLDGEYSRGAKETMDKFEKSAKELYNVESVAQGIDLVKEIVNSVSECNVITDDNVKKHPLYLELEKKTVSKEVHDTLVSEFDDFKSNQDKTSRLSTIKRDVLAIFSNLKPIVSENQAVAQTRQRDFLGKFDAYDYEPKDDGNHLILQNGSRVEDKHGNAVKFEDFVKGIALLNYDFKASDDKGNAGNRNNGSGGSVDVPKDEKDYLAKMNALMILGDREATVKLQKAWDESQK